MLLPPQEIECERLRLRRIQIEDATAIFQSYGSHPEVSRYMTWPRPHEVSETEAWVASAVRAWQTGDVFDYVVEERGAGRIVGGCGVSRFPGGYPGHFLLGYCFAPSVWNRGYATEATRAVVRWFCDSGRSFRLGATVDCDNPASCRVLEKSGFECEGKLRSWVIHPNLGPHPRDVFLFSFVQLPESANNVS